MNLKRLKELAGLNEVVSMDQAQYAHDEEDAHHENSIRKVVTNAEKIIDDVILNPIKYSDTDGGMIQRVNGGAKYNFLFLFHRGENWWNVSLETDRRQLIGQLTTKQIGDFKYYMMDVYSKHGWKVDFKDVIDGNGLLISLTR